MKIEQGRIFGGKYRLESLIAIGGMGEVWEARNLETKERVAIKVLRDDLAGQSQFLERLEIEAANARKMEHPNLAAVLDSGTDGQTGWLVMELVPGFPLTDYLEGGQTLEVGQLLPILYQCALALTAVHSANVVHRDIKPGNILIRPDGVVKLTDFGISRSDSQVDLTAAGMVMGTAQYLPPEQAKGNIATPSGDLYGLGIIAYEALVGKRPFTGSTQVDIAIAHVNQKVPPLPDSIPPLMRTLVMSLLNKEPVNRPPDAAAFARQVAYVADQLQFPIEPLPLGKPRPSESAKLTPTDMVPQISGEPTAKAEPTATSLPIVQAQVAADDEIPSRVRLREEAEQNAEPENTVAEPLTDASSQSEAADLAEAINDSQIEALSAAAAVANEVEPELPIEVSPPPPPPTDHAQTEPAAGAPTQAGHPLAEPEETVTDTDPQGPVAVPESASDAPSEPEADIQKTQPVDHFGPVLDISQWDSYSATFTQAIAIPEANSVDESGATSYHQRENWEWSDLFKRAGKPEVSLFQQAPVWVLLVLLLALVVLSVLIQGVIWKATGSPVTQGMEGTSWLMQTLVV
ncbi:hypothetical protein BSR29_00230 [Boudabousia liubingyangii]|uniref:non-specific serine/threonine protein kinase n=1 Tax=Boudabousia liubingyangii TaxID=1921764 RepID=A0A1Q5PPI0_9ACTO|nr:serine/threonine-protein kinase [Boudabousia liubingyangii]OKL49433.1 hypothetical protein BSR29_00230 [Boudabousia liubingyangii]